MKRKKGFLLYNDYYEHIKLLSNEEVGLLTIALFEYAESKKLPNFEGGLAMAFSFIRAQMDRDGEKYEETCRKREAAGKMGGRSKQGKAKVKPLTYSSYEVVIKNHIKPAIGAMKLQDVKGIHVQKLYNGMMAKDLSAKTVKNVAAVLHKALSMAQKQGMIQVNPCDAAELPKATQKEIKPLTDAEIPLFLKAIDKNPMRNAYALCLFAGLREGECLGLSWDQVNFETHRITVSQQLQHEKKKGAKYYIAPTTKSGKPREIEPPEIAFQYLRAEQKRQAENRLAAGTWWDNPHNLVFTTETGENIAISTFYKTFKKIAAEIGRPDARPHDLRHTAATIAVAAGADIKSVQDLLGHATASFTLNVYTHTSDQMKKDTASRMQNYYDNLTLKKA